MKSFRDLGITTDTQLVELAKKMKLPPIQYIGFAEDMPELKDGLSIINIGGDKWGGTHWTMLWAQPEYVIYSDTYGVGPEDRIIQLANGRDVIYNTKQIQRYEEEFCGPWALLTAHAIVNQKNKEQALNTFMDRYHAV